jgi:hypothetical protein
MPPILLCGLKADLEHARNVSPDCAAAFAEANRMGFLENSSKTGLRIEETKQLALDLILRFGIKVELSDSQSLRNSEESLTKTKSGCC